MHELSTNVSTEQLAASWLAANVPEHLQSKEPPQQLVDPATLCADSVSTAAIQVDDTEQLIDIYELVASSTFAKGLEFEPAVKSQLADKFRPIVIKYGDNVGAGLLGKYAAELSALMGAVALFSLTKLQMTHNDLKHQHEQQQRESGGDDE